MRMVTSFAKCSLEIELQRFSDDKKKKWMTKSVANEFYSELLVGYMIVHVFHAVWLN